MSASEYVELKNAIAVLERKVAEIMRRLEAAEKGRKTA